jgi:pilus assembly protein CpaB
MRRPNSIIILIVALAMGGIAAFLARNWLLSRTQVSASVTTTIVAAARPLPFGTTLNKDNIEVIPWAAKNIPPGAFRSAKDLLKGGRRVTLGSIERDEPILKSKITGPGQRASLSTLLDKDKRAITIRVDDVRGVAGFILPKDRVDVMLNRSTSGKHYSDLLLQDIKVIAVDQLAAEKKDHPIVAKAVTLEVTPYQAQKISLASNIGRLSLILRRAGDSGLVANRRVTDVDLLEAEAHKIPAPIVESSKLAAEKSAPAEKPAPVQPDIGAIVSVVRNLKSEDYKVIKE